MDKIMTPLFPLEYFPARVGTRKMTPRVMAKGGAAAGAANQETGEAYIPVEQTAYMRNVRRHEAMHGIYSLDKVDPTALGQGVEDMRIHSLGQSEINSQGRRDELVCALRDLRTVSKQVLPLLPTMAPATVRVNTIMVVRALAILHFGLTHRRGSESKIAVEENTQALALRVVMAFEKAIGRSGLFEAANEAAELLATVDDKAEAKRLMKPFMTLPNQKQQPQPQQPQQQSKQGKQGKPEQQKQQQKQQSKPPMAPPPVGNEDDEDEKPEPKKEPKKPEEKKESKPEKPESKPEEKKEESKPEENDEEKPEDEKENEGGDEDEGDGENEDAEDGDTEDGDDTEAEDNEAEDGEDGDEAGDEANAEDGEGDEDGDETGDASEDFDGEDVPCTDEDAQAASETMVQGGFGGGGMGGIEEALAKEVITPQSVALLPVEVIERLLRGTGNEALPKMEIKKLPFTKSKKITEGKSEKPMMCGAKIRAKRLCSAVTPQPGRMFLRRGKRDGGTVLIDASGSMALDSERLSQLAERLPVGTIAYYSGSGRYGHTSGASGILTIYAEHRRCYTLPKGSHLPDHYNGNEVDFAALQWLLKQPGPRWFITDCGFCGGGRIQGKAARILANKANKRKLVKFHTTLGHLEHELGLIREVSERDKSFALRAAKYFDGTLKGCSQCGGAGVTLDGDEACPVCKGERGSDYS